MKKKQLRKEFLARRSALETRGTKIRNLLVLNALLESFDFKSVKLLHHFISLAANNEVDTGRIVKSIKEVNPQIRFAVPRVNPKIRSLEHLELNAETELSTSEWGIPEPVGDYLIDERTIDFVLVPLLCFDRAGHRVGYGGGFYDRFLARCRPDCLKVGLSFFPPIEKIEDIHERDVKLDFCVTPEGTISIVH
jgi:5-formyltetrahydrofolate cyclo-ligase